MGWLSNLFKKETPTQTKYAEVMSGYAPIFSQFGTNVYASDVVQQAISCIVSEMKKLRPEHIREKGNDIIPVNSNLQSVLNNPNPKIREKLNIAFKNPTAEDDMTGIFGKYYKLDKMYKVK